MPEGVRKHNLEFGCYFPLGVGQPWYITCPGLYLGRTGPCCMNRCKTSEQHKFMTFDKLVEQVLRVKSACRRRTTREIAQYSRRLTAAFPDFGAGGITTLSADDCEAAVMSCWQTPATRNKARRILHSIFAYAVQRGWIEKNPLDGMAHESVKERRVYPLTLVQIRRLLRVVNLPQNRCCAPAVGLMLWAGIRPNEVERLQWSDIRFEHRVIVLSAEHSKTGGARQVTLHPILYEWLKRKTYLSVLTPSVIPRAWVRRWRDIRVQAGFKNWSPDTLRHTFASYHILKFGDFSRLQMEMGHASTDLLRTRYISLDNITREDADIFWGSLNRLLAEPRKSDIDRGNTGAN